MLTSALYRIASVIAKGSAHLRDKAEQRDGERDGGDDGPHHLSTVDGMEMLFPPGLCLCCPSRLSSPLSRPCLPVLLSASPVSPQIDQTW